MRRIPKKALHRPLQGGAFAVSPGGLRRPATLSGSFQAAHDKANAANERRYGQLMQGYDDLHGRVMGGLEGAGKQEREDIMQLYRNRGSDAYQRMVRRGFANSSMFGPQGMMIAREQSSAMGRLNDRLVDQRARYDTAISQGKLGAIERRNDVGPDPSMLVNLARGIGAGGSGYGGTGGPYMLPPTVDGMSPQMAYQNALGNFLGMATFRQPMGVKLRKRPGYGSQQRQDYLMHGSPLRFQ